MVDPYTVVASVVLAGVVSALVAARVSSRPETRGETETTVTPLCAVCGEAGESRAAIRDHLKDIHNVPGKRSDLNSLIEVAEPHGQ